LFGPRGVGKTTLIQEQFLEDEVLDIEFMESLETLGVDTDPKAEKWLLSNDELEQKFGSTRALPWKKALEILF
jgi:predicted AAA+ superfamily ATPase